MKGFSVGFLCGIALAVLSACLGGQIAGMQALVAVAEARTAAIVATKELDHEKQVQFRTRLAAAKTEQEALGIKAEVVEHNRKRDAVYTLLGELFTEAVRTTRKSIESKRLDLSGVLVVVDKLIPALQAVGVKDAGVFSALAVIRGGT